MYACGVAICQNDNNQPNSSKNTNKKPRMGLTGVKQHTGRAFEVKRGCVGTAYGSTGIRKSGNPREDNTDDKMSDRLRSCARMARGCSSQQSQIEVGKCAEGESPIDSTADGRRNHPEWRRRTGNKLSIRLSTRSAQQQEVENLERVRGGGGSEVCAGTQRDDWATSSQID